jgi:hypothetical protein
MKNPRFHVLVLAAALAGIPLSFAWAQAPAPSKSVAPATAQPNFATPEDAVKALVAALRAGDRKAVIALMGAGSDYWLFTGDGVADADEWSRFLAAYDKKSAVAKSGDAKASLVIGADDWVLPAPLVKKGERWVFDGAAGSEETTNRRVGRNELNTIQTLLAIVDAQREYATNDVDRNGVANYARRFVSTPGTRDGLYWPVPAGAPQSPLGPLVGAATKEGYGAQTSEPRAYHGYHFRLLTAQGADAKGGAYDYVVKDQLLGGFAVVAWPSKYGVSGVMSFVVNQDGVVYEKDLGAGTASAVAKIPNFNPDKSWKRSEPQ